MLLYSYALLLLCTYALFCFCHLYGGKDGGFHAGGTGEVSACDVESRSVSGRRPYYRDADSYINGVLEIEQLHRYHTLVVIHCDDSVELAVDGTQKERVGWKWAEAVYALVLCQ